MMIILIIIILVVRGGILIPAGKLGKFPESLRHTILAGIILVGRLGVSGHSLAQGYGVGREDGTLWQMLSSVRRFVALFCDVLVFDPLGGKQPF